MIQRHRLLINLSYSANTENTVTVTASTLTTVGGYQINNVQGLGGGITNPSNVRHFLNDDVNDFIINDFFSYLTGSTTTVEFAEIYNSDQKLSDVFNDYYVSSIVNNQAPSTAVVDNSLTETEGITVIENGIFGYNGVAPSKGLTGITQSIDNSVRNLRTYSALTTFTDEESYYIPVFIKRNSKQMARLLFEACDERVSTILNLPQNNGGSGIEFEFETIGPSGLVGNFNIERDVEVSGQDDSPPAEEVFLGPAESDSPTLGVNIGSFTIR